MGYELPFSDGLRPIYDALKVDYDALNSGYDDLNARMPKIAATPATPLHFLSVSQGSRLSSVNYR
jgi:hypothetical protein